MDGSFGLNIVKNRMGLKTREPKSKQQCNVQRQQFGRHWQGMSARMGNGRPGIISKDGETVESYYKRFDEHVSRQKEDEDEAEAGAEGNKKVNSQHNYLFVDNLNVAIKSAFLQIFR